MAATAFAMVSAVPALAAPVDYQAEDAVITQGVVESNHAGYTGRGFVNYTNTVGSAVEWTVTAARAGNASLVVRYANGTAANRAMDITVDGTVAAPAHAFPGTGAWTTWVETAKITVPLKAGANKVKATSTTADGGPNVDRISVDAPTDVQPPTAPKNLAASDLKPRSVKLTWEASQDDVGVVRYEVNNGGNVIKRVDGSTLSTVVDGLTPRTSYDLTVLAYDAAGNASQASNSVQVTTPESDDKEPPTVPGNLRQVSVTATSATVAWNASTDNSGVIAGYDLYRDGVKVATTTSLQETVTGLQANKEYTFTVTARDPDGNVSGAGGPLKVKTSGSAGGGVPEFDREILKLDLAWEVAFLPDGTALATERDRREIVHITASGQKTVVGPVPNSANTNGEGGVMGLAISPAFTSDRYIYVFHTSPNDNRIVRMKYENNALGAPQVLASGWTRNRFHNGGRLKFGPDGKLYAGTGDAQNPSNAQNKNTLNGKILRINPDGSIPADNPFGTAVWSWGHRNVQGLAWDSRGQLWASEFGDGDNDELNLIQKGGNYGYGGCSGGGCIAPKQTWGVAEASPSGIEIVNDWVYMAAVRGARLWYMKINAAGNDVETPQSVFSGRWGRLRTAVKAPDGGLWITSTNNDKDGGSPNTLDNVVVRLKFPGGGTPDPDFKLSSTAFADNAMIPAKYTCAGDGTAGQDPSPPLAWGAGTTGAKAYAIVFADRAGSGNKMHWSIWDIPAATLALPEGLAAGFTVPNQGGAKQKAMGSGANSQKYFGPCPGGSTNPYTFTLYALNTTTVPGLTASSTMAQIETAIKANSTANTVLRGRSNASAG